MGFHEAGAKVGSAGEIIDVDFVEMFERLVGGVDSVTGIIFVGIAFKDF